MKSDSAVSKLSFLREEAEMEDLFRIHEQHPDWVEAEDLPRRGWVILGLSLMAWAVVLVVGYGVWVLVT